MALETDPRVLLLDADGNLFPSEEPAFVASADVTNRFLAALGVDARYGAEELRAVATGRNFRNTAAALAAEHGVEPGDLDAWVLEEKSAVSAHLGRVLRPDGAVGEPLRRLAADYELAAVSSSALSRLDACFRATGLDDLIPAGRRFSAEDSLPRPASKPDPAVYRLAAERLGCADGEALAVEDSVAGVQSAVAAGIPAVGNVQFVGGEERAGRTADLRAAGACAVVASWEELAAELAGVRGRTCGS
jgi:beta-phosphoglucomutase-like phosphatase (HAD superfamily)